MIKLKDYYGETPLGVASRYGHAEICKYLVEEKNAHVYAALQYKTDPEIRNKNLNTIYPLYEEWTCW